MKLFCRSILAFFSTIIVCSTALAGRIDGVLEGEYIPVSGWVESIEVSRPDLGEAPRQLGKFKLVLKRKDWKLLSDEEQSRIRKKLVIKGTLVGEFDLATGTLSHVLANKQRTGVLYSQGDTLTPTQGDPICSAGVNLEGSEQVNIVAGTGEYAGLLTGTVFVKGVVNNCPGTAEFLQNNFEVEANKGSFIF